MLLQILDFIKRADIASTQQIAREFSIEEQALLPMLKLWENKGCIKTCDATSGCKTSCLGCQVQTLVYYQFIKS